MEGINTMTRDTKFEFRTKFKNLLNENNCSAIINAFNQFCSLDSKSAINMLWGLTYSQNRAFEELNKLGLDFKFIPAEKVLVFRNELRYQYERNVQSYFLQSYQKENDEKISKTFLALTNRTDAIVASVVYNLCNTVIFNTDVERILFLLKSEKESYYFGGIRVIGFDIAEAEYLKPFHLEIHNLLKAINEYIPFYIGEKEGVVVEEKGESNKEITTETPKLFKSLTPEEILINRDVFKAYVSKNDMNILVVIANLGYDLNEVMAKTEKIQNFLLAVENFN